ncbi:hypothetical protein C8R46DRAFT_1341422 [Mycena filopes]|nr:hypothetical protein C8R46DRAFT_1341422 [Mycena filopes]
MCSLPRVDHDAKATIQLKSITTNEGTIMLSMLEQRLEAHREAAVEAKRSRLREEAKAAYLEGDFKTAFILYTGCGLLRVEDPVTSLNRAAVALKLKLYEWAIRDAEASIEKADDGYGGKDFNRAKAYFRRGQGYFHLGHWREAAEDYAMALSLRPGDHEIEGKIEELKKLRGTFCKKIPGSATCSCDHTGLALWEVEQAKANLEDIFAPGEFLRRAEEVVGIKCLDM